MGRDKSTTKTNGVKHDLQDDFVPLDVKEQRPAKKARLLDDSDDESDEEGGGVSLKVNEEYARRFEHNKKREDLHRLEAKYGNGQAADDDDDDDSEEDSEADVSEDDDGELATEAVDAEWLATLNAIRSKDPAVYKKDVTFYTAMDDDQEGEATGAKKEKAMTLRDYHTQNLLNGKFGGEEDEDAPPKTYAQEQADVKQDLVRAMHADAASDDEDDFLIAKSKPQSSKKTRTKITEADIENADKDPETFLSNFMAARAWVPSEGAKWQPLESDDEDDEERAEEFEDAYNMYFEDPAGTNEKIVTYARDAVASTTVRRDAPSARQKARDAARAKREAEKQEKEEDLARLRKLKIEAMEEKVDKIRTIAGATGNDFNVAEWAGVLEADWSDEQWDAEMRKRFGDAYYDGEDAAMGSESEGEGHKSKKPKKPKWDDDIDIKDLIPDFVEDDNEEPPFSLSSDEEDVEAGAEDEPQEGQSKPRKTPKQKKQERADAKHNARRDRRLIESMVDASLEYDAHLASNPKVPTKFRYRETSPTNFGLSARDILLANDSQLNQFAGLKKLASFRDPAKKKKDKKHLSKKARLRQWRVDTFGDEEGPQGGFETLLGNDAGVGASGSAKTVADGNVDIREGDGKKKRRNRKKKSAAAEA